MFEKEAEEYIKEHTFFDEEFDLISLDVTSKTAFQDGAEYGYNKAKEEMQAQEYSVSYEDGIFKCKYKSGKEFESVDGKAWKEVLLPKENK